MSQIITNAFSRYWQECLTNQTPVVLDEFVLANIPNLDPNKPISPDLGLPPANQIVHRRPVDQRGRINNDAVAYTIVMDTTVGDFSFNAMYLINKATGVVGMIVHKGLETKLKTNDTTGQTGNSLVKSMLMEYDRAPDATATHVDAGTWQIDYAARLRGMDDDLRLQALQFFGPATFYGNAFNLVNEAGIYKVQPGVAYVGGLRAQLDEVKKVTPSAKPVGLWLDIHRAGSLLDAWVNYFTLTLSVPELTDYLDANGHQHHVAKVAIINANGSVTDLRRKRTIELSGDVAGKGILEDAQGVNIAVEIKAGSHRHPWSELDGVPASASRWPSWAEVTSKPDLAAQEHAHNYLTPRNLDWNTQTDAFMTGSAQAPKGSGSSEFLSWISWGHNGGSKYRHTLFSPTSAIQQLWYGFKANTSDTTSPSTNARIYHTYDKPTPAEIGAAAASHSHSWGQISGIPAYATRWPSWAEVTGKPASMPPSAHNHPWAQITGAPAQATRWPAWGEVTGKPATMPPTAHTHSAAAGNADIVASGFGQVGTYVFARCDGTSNTTIGGTVAGSRLRPCSVDDDPDDETNPGLGGTWKCLGRSLYGALGEGEWKAAKTLWIRIA
ncbi:phage tail-collar fiber domain-containing protein [Aeromonas eucrenophila]|uniref:Phage tail protein n=1 Tax=Aeromonas eucrenophila TaxID=649 RepID=A0ABW0YGS7_9GAMM|nr:phage tail protein [Aeromonas eucrenophila]